MSPWDAEPRHEAEPTCPKASAVLAIHLDGDVDASGFGFVCNETLSGHLASCPSCQRLLQRARRLDAVLASTAGRTLLELTAAGGASLDAAAQRWFATATASPVTAAPAPEPAAAGSGSEASPRQRLATAAAACLLAGALLAGFLLWAHTPAVAAPSISAFSVGVPAPPALQPEAAASTALVIAPDAVWRARREVRPADSPLLSVTELQRRAADAGATLPNRLVAARALFAACHPFAPDSKNAMRALVDVLAGLGDRSTAERMLHRDLLELARSTPHVLAFVQTRLQHLDAPGHDVRGAMNRFDLAVLTVAARLQERELDLAIRRAVRRDPHAAATVAAALRCGLREAGAVALMLDAWHDLATRGAVADDQDAAWSWFGGQQALVFDELQQELRTSRSAPRRLRCVLGLGCAADDRTVPALLALLQGNDHAEAHAAAFALAGLPHRCLRGLLPRAIANEGQFLLRAALARAALAETRSWPLVMALTASEQRLLSCATLAQFPEVASWFRDRATALSD